MQYVITTDRQLLESWQSQVDQIFGYPEPLEQFIQVGCGPHAPVELGRAMHFAEIETDQTGTRFALPLPEGIDTPEGVEVVEELPNDWQPPLEAME